MNESDAVVVRVEGAYAWVEAAGAGHACGACARREGCRIAGAGSILDESPGQTPTTRILRFPNAIHARPGDAVVIRAADGMVWRAALLAYGLPLLLAMIAAVLAHALTGSDGMSVAALLLGLGIGFVILRRQPAATPCREPILSIGFKSLSR